MMIMPCQLLQTCGHLGNPKNQGGPVPSRQSSMDELKLMEFGSGDVGMPGDKFRIRLRIAGRYRSLAAGQVAHQNGFSMFFRSMKRLESSG